MPVLIHQRIDKEILMLMCDTLTAVGNGGENIRKAGNSISRPAGRFCIGRSSWDVVGHRPGIGYVSSNNRGIGRASCVEPMPARRRQAVSNIFDIAGRPADARPTPGRPMFWVVLVRKRHTSRRHDNYLVFRLSTEWCVG